MILEGVVGVNENQAANDVRDAILIVDDEENLLSSLRRLFRQESYDILLASCPEEGLRILSERPISLVISDYAMPGMTGTEFLKIVRRRWPDTIRIILTGYANVEATMEAINQGEVYRFATKPWDPMELRLMVRQGLDQYHLVHENKRMRALIEKQNQELTTWNERLQMEVEESTRETRESKVQVEALYYQLKKIFISTIEAMGSALAVRDPYTAGHQRRVRALAGAIATEMGLSCEQIDTVQLAAAVHDFGKIAVPAEVLNKSGRLSDLEMNIIRVHPQVAYDVLQNVDFPWPIAEIVLQHHERVDGKGYPNGLNGSDILLEARIINVADVVEAMASHRPYRPAISMDIVLKEMDVNRGTCYDPGVVDALLQLLERAELEAYLQT